MDAAGRGTAVSPVEIRHRTIPERLAWLAARLREEKDWRELLPILVRCYVLPALDQKVTVADITTNHNPIRAVTVDGQDAERYWYEPADCGPALTPEWVTVPLDEVLRMAQQGRAPDAATS